MNTPIELGPFTLTEAFVSGGMGEVWRGVHREQGVPVAVKVTKARRAREPGAVAAFRREVQLTSGLDHPAIVMVLDYGELDAEAASRTEGRLVAGSPYLVMEYADGGSLGDVLRTRLLQWPEIKYLLLTLLDGLAHAHARGVIHRDIKPGNVLFFEGVGWKLTDFGIAQALYLHREGVRERSQGTPSYMSPEQLLGFFRDYGPWTDLYALGCLTYRLVSGAPPFQADTVERLARKHIKTRLPPLRPRMKVPGGLSLWLKRILAKRPRERFQRAADAARALLALGSEPPVLRATLSVGGVSMPIIAEPMLATPVPPTATTQVFDEHALPPPMRQGTMPTLGGVLVEAAALDASYAGPGGEALERPGFDALSHCPVPQSWTLDVPPRRQVALLGAGLGLYGLRMVPMVGRHAERSWLWDLLYGVWRDGAPRVAVLTGAAGTGKSRLAEWLCERAHEVGAAEIFRAQHIAGGGASSGLDRMVAHHLRCVGLSKEHTLQNVAQILKADGVKDDWEHKALTEIVHSGAGARLVQFQSPAERFAVTRRLIERAARRRAVIVWLDDVQWGAAALDFVHAVLEAWSSDPGSRAVLFVLTGQDESLAELPASASSLEALAEREESARLVLEAMGRGEIRQLVEQTLGLRSDVVELLAERCAGNPMLAIQTIGAWVQQGLLEVRPDGFVLRSSAPVDVLPDNLHKVWSDRVDRLMAERSTMDRVALELAATLGQHIVSLEWEDACRLAGMSAVLAGDLVEVLVSRRLARWTEDGWAFVHGMLNASILLPLSPAQRRDRSRVVGTILADRFERTRMRGLAERAGILLRDADVLDRAVELLLSASVERRVEGRFAESHALLDLTEELSARMNTTSGLVRVRVDVLRVSLLKLQGHLNEAMRVCDRAETAARTAGWDVLLGEVLLERADVAGKKGYMERSASYAQEALDLYRKHRHFKGVAQVAYQLGLTMYQRGRAEKALALYTEARRLHRDQGDIPGTIHATKAIGDIKLHLGDLEEAERLYHEAYELSERHGIRHTIIVCLNSIGELQRASGDLDAAEATYRRVLELFEAMGAVAADVPRVNLALVKLARGDYEGARGLFEASLRSFEATGRYGLLGGVHIELMPCAAARGSWEDYDRHFEEGARLLAECDVADYDDAWPAELAGDLARDAGQGARADRAYALALTLWRKLGYEDRVEGVEARIATLRKRA